MTDYIKSRCPECRILPTMSGKCPRCHQQVRPERALKQALNMKGVKGRKFMDAWDEAFNLRPIPERPGGL